MGERIECGVRFIIGYLVDSALRSRCVYDQKEG